MSNFTALVRIETTCIETTGFLLLNPSATTGLSNRLSGETTPIPSQLSFSLLPDGSVPRIIQEILHWKTWRQKTAVAEHFRALCSQSWLWSHSRCEYAVIKRYITPSNLKIVLTVLLWKSSFIGSQLHLNHFHQKASQFQWRTSNNFYCQNQKTLNVSGMFVLWPVTMKTMTCPLEIITVIACNLVSHEDWLWFATQHFRNILFL